MKIINLLKTCFTGIACLALVTSSVVAQDAFRAQPSPDDDAGQDDPIIVRPQQDRAPSRPFQLPDDREETPDQAVLLNAKFAGWQAAGTGQRKDRVSKDLRASWIMVDDNGRFEGSVVPGEGAGTEGMTIYLMHMGRLVKDTTVDERGKFEFTNVGQGAYALVGWGTKGFFAFGLNILEVAEDATPNLPNSVNVIAFQNVSSINTDWIQFFSPRVSYRVYGRYPSGEGKDDPASLYGFVGLAKYMPAASPATSISAHTVKLNAAGELLGRVHQLTSDDGRPVDVRSTKIMLLKGDEVVASTDADNYGVFELSNVETGEYGLAAVGVDGVGLIGINVGEADAMNDQGEFSTVGDAEPFDFCLISSETIGWLNNYATELAYRRNLLAPRRPSPDERLQTCTNCDGAGCQNCQGTGLCKSPCQSFEDWAANCAGQHERTKIGSGFILSEASKDLRRAVQRTENLFENAFYGANGGGTQGTTDYNNGGANNGVYDQGYDGSGGYNQGGYAPAPGYAPNN